MGMEAQIVEQFYKLLVEGVLVGFEPCSTARLCTLEEVNGLNKEVINYVEWIKLLEKCHPGQRTTYLILTISGIEQANWALKGLLIIGHNIVARCKLIRFKHCARCQSYDSHFAKECPLDCDICTICISTHLTMQCNVKDLMKYQCVGCDMPHCAMWDCNCPTLHSKVCAHSARWADSRCRFL